MGQVSQLVGDDVLNESRLQHHSSPVKAQSSVGRATSPALALIANEYVRHISLAQTGPPASDNAGEPLRGAVTVPLDNCSTNGLVTLDAIQGFGYSDTKLPMVEADLRRSDVCRFDY